MHASFESIHHPGETPSGAVYARRLAGPIGACTVPIMIGAAAAALQGQLVWPYLVWGLPAALGTASVWTHFRLAVTPAELHLRGGQCAVRSVFDVLSRRPVQWDALYGMEESTAAIRLSFGWTTQVCRRREWPRFADLRRASQEAVHGQSAAAAETSSSLE